MLNLLSKIASATGGAMATKVFDNVVNQNKQPIIAADTNQIVGYADDGPFGRVYTGRPDYNPFGADGQPSRLIPRQAYWLFSARVTWTMLAVRPAMILLQRCPRHSAATQPPATTPPPL